MERRRHPTIATGSGKILLGQVASWLSVIDVACNHCPRRGRLHPARLVAKYGAEMPVAELLRIAAADCPRTRANGTRDVCGIHLPQLAGLRL
jgi:hypothetical protein